MHHTVSDRVDLAHGFDHAVFLAGERVNDELNAFAVVRDVDFGLVGVALEIRLLEVAAVDADAVALAFGKQCFVGHVDKLILNGGASGVDNQYFHVLNLSVM